MHEPDKLLRTAVSGALLFCVFAVARWSDFARLENVWTDKCEDLVLVEAETARHKTSKSKEAKTRLLPFTAIGRFECEEAWGECFVDALDSIKHDTGLPFLPSWNDRSGDMGHITDDHGRSILIFEGVCGYSAGR